MLCIDPSFFLFIALLLLTLPPDWVAAAFYASLIHELCHLTAVVLLRGKVRNIHIGIWGARMDALLPDRKAECLALLAGSAGSLVLMFLCRLFPRMALCGSIQGLYNLLPIRPLDGGRALLCVLEGSCPGNAERIMHLTENIAVCLLLVAAVYGASVTSLGIFCLFPVLIPMAERIRRNTSCKQGRIGVQ